MALRKNNKTGIDFVWLDREMLLAENSIRLFSWKDAAGSDKNNPSEERISGGSKKAHAFNCFSARNTDFTQTSNAQSANATRTSIGGPSSKPQGVDDPFAQTEKYLIGL